MNQCPRAACGQCAVKRSRQRRFGWRAGFRAHSGHNARSGSVPLSDASNNHYKPKGKVGNQQQLSSHTGHMIESENLPIVLLPGMDGTGILLSDLSRRLSAWRQVEVISYPSDKRMDYEQLSKLVAERIPCERFVILGESFSGPIAIQTAAQEPTKVAGLILASTFARHPMPSLFAAFIKAIDPNWIPRSIVEAILMGDAGTPEIKAALGRALSEVSGEVIQYRAVQALSVDHRHFLREVTCPVLCLTGRRDRLVRYHNTRLIEASLPICEVRIFDAPHMLLETHTVAAAEAISQFCERLSSAENRLRPVLPAGL